VAVEEEAGEVAVEEVAVEAGVNATTHGYKKDEGTFIKILILWPLFKMTLNPALNHPLSQHAC
jgi:hypothetical protein